MFFIRKIAKLIKPGGSINSQSLTLRRGLLVSLIFAFLASMTFQAVPVFGGAITGVVTDDEMNPIENACIYLEWSSYRDTSDINGEYFIADIDPDTYDIIITHSDYCDTIIPDITINLNDTITIDIILGDAGVITGIVKDTSEEVIEGVIVSVLGISINDTTDSLGEYDLTGICPGTYSIYLNHLWYDNIQIDGITIEENDTITQNVEMTPTDDILYIWAGGEFIDDQWHDTIVVESDQWIEIPIYFMSSTPDLYTLELCFPLGIQLDYVDSIVGGEKYDVFDIWENSYFGNYNDENGSGPGGPCPLGWASLSYVCGRHQMGDPYFHSEVPVLGLTFHLHVAPNDTLAGQTICGVLGPGVDYVQGPANVGDTLGRSVPIAQDFACLRYAYDSGNNYLAGDVNMYTGVWPPAVIGGDATYLVNYFRGMSTSQPCYLDGFWCSADANGDCNVIGSDVTYLITYLRGGPVPQYCPDYEPNWLTPADLPTEAPLGWPNCE